MQPETPNAVELNPPDDLSSASKSFLRSRTFLGLIIAVLPLILKFCGVQLGEAETQAAAGDLVTILGAALALYGRIKASQPLHLAPPKLPTPPPGSALLLVIGMTLLGICLQLTGCVTTTRPDGTKITQPDPATVQVLGAVASDYLKSRARAPKPAEGKAVVPLSLRGSVLDLRTDLGGPLREPFRLDVEVMQDAGLRMQEVTFLTPGLWTPAPSQN